MCNENGASERIRTSDHSVRSRVLYPAELRMQESWKLRVTKNGASERIRTSDHSVRSRVLYPAELRMHYAMAVREGFEPSMRLLTACSLSRGVPSASRPPHRCGCRYYCAGKICQTFFPHNSLFAQQLGRLHTACTKRPFCREDASPTSCGRKKSGS